MSRESPRVRVIFLEQISDQKGMEAKLTRKYRSPIPLVAGIAACLAFFLIGVGGLANSKQPQVGVSGIVMGVLSVLISCLMAGIIISNVVVLAPSGLTYHQGFKAKLIEWESVESFEAARLPGLLPWSVLVVEIHPLGAVRIKNIAGSSRYVRRIVAELESCKYSEVL